MAADKPERVAPPPRRLFGTEKVREYLAKAEFRPLYHNELEWARCHLNIIDMCADFAYSEIEELRRELKDARRELTELEANAVYFD